MKHELNQTQAIYPPEVSKPKVCVTIAINDSIEKQGTIIAVSFLPMFVMLACHRHTSYAYASS